MDSGKIYKHTHLSQDNQTSTLETLHLIDTLHKEFPLDSIRDFYSGHKMREEKILFLGEETLSLKDIFEENEKLVAALATDQGLLEMPMCDIMALDVDTYHFTGVLDVAEARKQEVEAYIVSQSIKCTTAAIFAILVNIKEDVSVENVDFERLEAVFCTDCLIMYSMSHSGFRSSYTCFLVGVWRFNELISIADACFIPFSIFRPFSVFEAHELYLLYLKGKNIVDDDVREVRSMVHTMKHLLGQKGQGADSLHSLAGTRCGKVGENTESCVCQSLESLCLSKADEVGGICRDLVGIVLEKRSDNRLLGTRECIESMLLLEDRVSLMYGVKTYRRQIVEHGISTRTKVQEVEDARAVLEFIAATKEKDKSQYKRGVHACEVAGHEAVQNGMSEKSAGACAKRREDVGSIPILDDYTWLEEDEKAVLLEAYKEMYPSEGLVTLTEVCRLGKDGNGSETQNPLDFLLAASRLGATDMDMVDGKISALNRREIIEFAHKAQSLENFKPWFCTREPTLNISRVCAAIFLKKVSDPIETLYTMRENMECLFSLADAYDPLVLLPLISSILERDVVSPKFIMETQRYLIQTVLKDSFFAEDNLVFIKRIVDLVLCADLSKRHRATIERNCDEIIGLLKKYAVFFDKKIFVRNIK